MMNNIFENRVQAIEAAVDYIKQQIGEFIPTVGLVLGSGLGDYAESIDAVKILNYRDIPGFPLTGIVGHAGRLIFGVREGQNIVVMQGRVHYYEGYPQGLATLPVRIMRRLGVKTLILTNAVGAVNLNFPVGSLMLATDHINYSGSNPLIGENIDEDGERFIGMTHTYNQSLRKKLMSAAKAAGITLFEGVYMMFSGPSYETPAEIRMARTMGADVVGMSTVPEAIVARHCGMEVIAVSCVSNLAAGISGEELNHHEVLASMERAKGDFARLMDLALREVV
jgi:purine-nucleoside phosphorylase